jgi:hypothetical protein
MFTVQLDMLQISPDEDNVILKWTLNGYSSEAFSGVYELQQARDMEFASAHTIYQGPLQQISLIRQFDEPAYFRVRTLLESGADANVDPNSKPQPGPWSNTVVVTPQLLSRQTVIPISDYDGSDILAVHSALLRLCVSDADKIAILSLPRHYQAEHAATHIERLTPATYNASEQQSIQYYGRGQARVVPLNPEESRALGFAALFHPWLYINAAESVLADQATQTVLACPADGAICGQMAVTSTQRGAWVASANKPLMDCVGLTTSFNEEVVVNLHEKQVNLIRTRPGQRIVMHWNTLSLDSDFVSLSVRRFMTLLVRMIRREGNRHVFETNDNLLRDAVRAFWEKTLSGLYRRGALRGRNADEAFRVFTGDEVNNRYSNALGRFYVELRVAPAKPMNFIVVRLTQTNTEQLFVQEL